MALTQDQLVDTIRDTLDAYLAEVEPGDEDTDDMAHAIARAIRTAEGAR
ncbi:hypothetical protein ACIOYT_00625 [Streptomyces halstedii]